MKTLDQIAAQLPGYDPLALRVETAAEFLHQLVEPITQSESVDLMQALGRVVACDIISPIHVPAHNNSAMDGYAFAGAQLTPGAALELRVVATALAGQAPSQPVAARQCVRIMTGAMLPDGVDTVIPLEMVQLQGETVQVPADAVCRGDNCRLAGEDIARGEVALKAGEPITPAALGLLASLGVPQVSVLRRLRVAYFSTGDEILSPNEAPREGAVYDSNRFTMFGLLTRMGIEVIDMGVVRDQPRALEAAFRSAASRADAIITSGGVSVGDADHTKATMRALAGGDAGVVFWKIAMRPGRPMAVGRIGPCLLLGLPGNPVAAMVTFLTLVRPALLRMMGCTSRQTPLLKAHSLETIRKKAGRTEFQRAVVTTSAQGHLQVRTTGHQGSGILSSMVQANGLLVLHHDQGDIAAGDAVDVMMLDGAV